MEAQTKKGICKSVVKDNEEKQQKQWLMA
jgi:hypothetical protein